MPLTIARLVIAMADTAMFFVSQVNQFTVTAPGIGVNNAFRLHFNADNGLHARSFEPSQKQFQFALLRLVWVEKRAIMEAVRKEKDHGNNHPGTGRNDRHASQCGKTYQGSQGENPPSDSKSF
jgi:hypothetical protein